MYHYILTLFTNVCFSRNNGILNPKKTSVYDALVGFNKKNKSTLGYSRSTCSPDANRLYCLQATIRIQLTNSLNAVKELPANPCFPFMQ